MTEEELIGLWANDPIQGTRLPAFKRHYEKHHAAVAAVDEAQYLRKAVEFSRNPRGRGVPVPGVRRWQKLGRYIDLTPSREIVSLGATE